MTGTAFSNVIPAFLLPGYSSGLQKWMHWMSKVTADPCTTPVVAWTETIINIKLSAEPVEGQKVFWWWWTTHHLKDLLGHDIHEPPQTSQVSLEDSSVGALMNVKELFVGHISIFLHSFSWKEQHQLPLHKMKYILLYPKALCHTTVAI